MGSYADAVSKRIVELSAQQGLIQSRATAEIASIQAQIDTLLEIDAAFIKDANLEPLLIKALQTDLGLPQRSR